MAVTHHDLVRLVEATGEAWSALVEWLSPDDVDMTGEPASFVELGVGRRLMVLARDGGACRLLDQHDRCRAYTARPYDCRLFPFHLDPLTDRKAARLSLLPLTDCDYASDGHTDQHQLVRDDRQRWLELAQYQEVVAQWNRLARHRRRLRRPLGNAEDFYRFLSP